jgi:hypothetical protein
VSGIVDSFQWMDADGDGDDDIVATYGRAREPNRLRRLLVLTNAAEAAARDDDGDGRIDDGDASFRRADVDANGDVELSDAVRLLGALFGSAASPTCWKSADADDDGHVDVTDGVSILLYLFHGGSAPPSPFGSCGSDPSGDPLGCEQYDDC